MTDNIDNINKKIDIDDDKIFITENRNQLENAEKAHDDLTTAFTKVSNLSDNMLSGTKNNIHKVPNVDDAETLPQELLNRMTEQQICNLFKDCYVVTTRGKTYIAKLQEEIRIVNTLNEVEYKHREYDFFKKNDFIESYEHLTSNNKNIANIFFKSRDANRCMNGICFKPLEDKTINNQLNIWTGYGLIEQKKSGATWETLEQHIFHNICKEQKNIYDYFMILLSHIIAYPHKKANVCFILKGLKGTGKTTIAEILKAIFGSHATMISDGEHIFGQFNDSLLGMVFIFLEEATYSKSNKTDAKVKDIATSGKMRINAKNKPIFEYDNILDIGFGSNENNVVKQTVDERRYLDLELGNRNRNDKEFFSKLWNELKNGGLTKFFYDMQKLAKQKNAIEYLRINKPPITSEAKKSIIDNLNDAERYIIESVFIYQGFVSDTPNIIISFGFNKQKIYTSDLMNKINLYSKANQIKSDSLKKLVPQNLKELFNIKKERETTEDRKWFYIIPPLEEMEKILIEKYGIQIQDI
jgi:hypothetical protein